MTRRHRLVRPLLLAGLCAGLLASPALAEEQPKPTPAQQAEIDKLEALAASEHPQQGDVMVPGADATLHLGKAYYFLDAADAKRVLVEAWGNPPAVAEGVLGLVFPAGKNFSDSWGAVVTWEGTGWVSDKDAKSTDYDKLIKQIQDGEDEENRQRKHDGFGATHLVGWAQTPTYDAATHSAIWARDIQFGGQKDDTLNYDVRLLGRRGVLSLNMVASMPDLPQVRLAAKDLAQTASFDPGARYTDYKPGIDKSAGYGIAGLVAAGLGLAAAKKLGLLAVILAFGKKFIVLIIAAFAGAGAWFKRQWARLTGKPVPPKPAAKGQAPGASHAFGNPEALPPSELPGTGTDGV